MSFTGKKNVSPRSAAASIISFIVPLAIIVMILGCSGASPVDFSKTEGVRINRFEFNKQSTTDHPDQLLRMTMEIENVGSKMMKGTAHAFVYGPKIMNTGARSGDWECKDKDANCPLSNKNPGVLAWALDAAGDNAFYPPDTEAGIPGSIKEFRVDLLPPNLLPETKSAYTFYARVCYPYETSSSSKVTKIAGNEFKASEADSSLAETKSSAGPIQITLNTQKELRSRDGKISLEFSVKNVGSGFPTAAVKSDDQNYCLVDVEASKRDVAKVTVTVNGKNIDRIVTDPEKECEKKDIIATKEEEPKKCYVCKDKAVRLVDGESTFRCDYEIPEGQEKLPKLDLNVVAQADYDYYVEKSLDIEVADDVDDDEKA